MRATRTLLVLCVIILSTEAQTSQTVSSLDVVVSDERGVAKTDLTVESFTLLEGGEVRDIKAFSPPDVPWNIVLMFDHSLAWLERDDNRVVPPNYVVEAWRAMAGSVNRFLRQVRSKDRIAIAAFEEHVEVLMDLRSVQSGQTGEVRFNAVVEPPGGLKDLYGAVEWSIEKLRGATGRKAVILFTDGRDGRLSPQWFMNETRQEIFDPLFGLIDSGEAEEFKKTSERVRSSGVRFYFLTVTTDKPPDFGGRPVSGLFPGSKVALDAYIARVRLRMEHIAELSGGRVMYAKSAEDAIDRYGRLYGDLKLGSLFTLEFTPGSSSEDLSPEIEVRLKEPNLRALLSRKR